MIILHIPSEYPANENPLSGIFVERHIDAISEYDRENVHIVLPLTWIIFIDIKHPLRSIKRLLNRKRENKYKPVNYKEYLVEGFVSNRVLFGSLGPQYYKLIMKSGIFKKIMQEGICLIHAHLTYPAGWIAMEISEEYDIPYIITEHMGPFPFINYRKENFSAKYIIDPVVKSSKIIAVSNYQKKEIFTYTKVTADVVPNVVELNKKQQVILKTEKVNFILVGLLTEVKGVDILIESVSILKNRKVSGFHITIVGSGAIESELKLMAKTQGVTDYFTWSGVQPHDIVVDMISRSDAFICSSRHESFGVAIVEALACGLPVIATDCGGPQDTVNVSNGILVAKENPEKLADGIEWMINNIGNFDRKQIMLDARDKYSKKSVAEKYLKIYKEVLR